MKNKINIEISGLVGTGKTTILLLLEEFLIKKGFLITRGLLEDYESENLKEKIKILKDKKTSIKLIEKQLNKSINE